LSTHRKKEHNGERNDRTKKPKAPMPPDALVNTYLVRQISKSTGKLSYKCKECDLDVNKIEAIKRHVMVQHFRVSLYQCSQCEAHFKSNEHLKNHTKELHGVELKSKKDSQREQLKLYYVLNEAGERTNMCRTCNKDYTSLKRLQVHIISKFSYSSAQLTILADRGEESHKY
jgi:DNA-directed RNA polymerase subunit RPC12/RpoP